MYTNDLFKGFTNGTFTKIDKNENTITVVSKECFKRYILDNELLRNEDSLLIEMIDDFNKNYFEFNKWIEVQDAVLEMKKNEFKKWKECEWPGFFLEYKFSYWTIIKTIDDYIKYMNNETKEKRLDFDIKFPKSNFYGDLKSSDIAKIDTMLNDAENIQYELEKCGKLWYLIYEHETIKDRNLKDFPYTKKRLDVIRIYDPKYKLGEDLTYSQRLKAKVNYRRMIIIEINKINYHTLLEKMTSNFHQPNHGATRKPKFKLTKYILLENVRNLVTHDNGNTWLTIKTILTDIGYRLTKEPLILSPHQFGIPQIRERVFIVGKYEPEKINTPISINFNNLLKKEENSIDSILEENADPSYSITKYEEMILSAWDEFYKGIDIKIIGFPIWVDYFKYKGSLGLFPKWKQEFIEKNKKLYERNKKFIDGWLKKFNNLIDFSPTHRKFEWQAGTSISSVWEGIIQLRPSGVRIKKPNCFQALVAIVQIPIIGKYRRRLTVRECARLQSFPDSFVPSTNKQQAYKQFGNSVNVEVLKKIFDELVKN